MTKPRFYDPYNVEIQRRIREFISPELIKELHERRAGRHFALVAAQTALLVGIGAVSYRAESPWIWVPLAFLQGFVILSFIILLHEQVHNAIFARRRPAAERLLGLLYSLPSSISASQFKRWHLDHHNELGSVEHDPKRAYLSPKRASRLLKALYMTPALFVIYSIAAAREARSYPASLRRTILAERLVFLALHVAFAVWLWRAGGPDAWMRVHFVPLFLAFPIAFTLNRLGQHYAVDATDPAKWSTLVSSHWFWDRIFLYSNLHLEHHYLVGVPCYNLPRLQRHLRPFYEKIGLEPYTYGSILHHWFVRNAIPHSDWRAAEDPPAGDAAPAVRR